MCIRDRSGRLVQASRGESTVEFAYNSLGLLMGIGGSVIFSTKRGRENEASLVVCKSVSQYFHIVEHFCFAVFCHTF